MPRSSSTRKPAAVVPPGDVTIARRRDRVAVLVEHRRRADEQLAHQRVGDRPGQPGQHAGVDQRLGDQEQVRRPTADQPGDSIEQGLGHAHHRADHAEDPLGPVEIVVGGERATTHRRRALSQQRGRVGNRAHDSDTVAARLLQGVDRDPGRDRQDATCPCRCGGACRRRGVVRLDGDQRRVARRNGWGDQHPGEHLGEGVAPWPRRPRRRPDLRPAQPPATSPPTSAAPMFPPPTTANR